jgi:iron-sulfur cluster repair protein YtfE (RIC family)
VNITDAFLGEHAMLYTQFEHIEEAAPVAGTLTVVQSLAASLTATLAGHAYLEDELLFSALGPIGPVAVMRMEHDQIEGLLDQISVTQDLRQAQGLLQQALQVARSHFAKEEQVLFPLAEQMLDQSVLVDLAAQWAERRGVTLR